MKTIYCLTDGGRDESGFTNEKLDCTVRAFALYTTMSYDKAHQLIQPFRKTGHKCPNFTAFLTSQFLFPAYYGRTVNQFLIDHPKGRFLLHIKNHVFAVIDGRIFDSSKVGLRKIVKAFI